MTLSSKCLAVVIHIIKIKHPKEWYCTSLWHADEFELSVNISDKMYYHCEATAWHIPGCGVVFPNLGLGFKS